MVYLIYLENVGSAMRSVTKVATSPSESGGKRKQTYPTTLKCLLHIAVDRLFARSMLLLASGGSHRMAELPDVFNVEMVKRRGYTALGDATDYGHWRNKPVRRVGVRPVSYEIRILYVRQCSSLLSTTSSTN